MTVLCILCHVYTTLPFSVPNFKIYFKIFLVTLVWKQCTKHTNDTNRMLADQDIFVYEWNEAVQKPLRESLP